MINPGNLIPLGSAGVGDRAALLERDDGVCAAGGYQNGYTVETSRLDPGKRWIRVAKQEAGSPRIVMAADIYH